VNLNLAEGGIVYASDIALHCGAEPVPTGGVELQTGQTLVQLQTVAEKQHVPVKVTKAERAASKLREAFENLSGIPDATDILDAYLTESLKGNRYAMDIAATDILEKIISRLTDNQVLALDAIDPYPIDPEEISRNMLAKLLDKSLRLVELRSTREKAPANTNL
jgi:hypothetical protein